MEYAPPKGEVTRSNRVGGAILLRYSGHMAYTSYHNY